MNLARSNSKPLESVPERVLHKGPNYRSLRYFAKKRTTMISVIATTKTFASIEASCPDFEGMLLLKL